MQQHPWIQTALTEHQGQIDDLEAAAFDWLGGVEHVALLRRLPETVAVVATLMDQRVCGYATGVYCQNGRSTNMWIAALAVSPSYRRRGIARALLWELLRRGRTSGVSRFRIEIEADNVAAIPLCRSLGFRTLRCCKDYYGPGMDAHMMAARS